MNSCTQPTPRRGLQTVRGAMGKRKWQQLQEPIPFAFRAPSTSHCTSPHLSTLTCNGGFFVGCVFFFSFSWRLEHLDGGSGRGEGTRQPVATKPVASLPAAGGTGNFCLGLRSQCAGLAGSRLRGVMDLFPSPPPPLLPLSLLGTLHSPNRAQVGCNKELPLPHPESAKSKRGS